LFQQIKKRKLPVKKPSYSELAEAVSKLLIRVEYLEAESIKDKLRIKSLEEELAVYKNPKNSGNSSVPPSKDENRIRGNQSLREKSGKKSGGQPGHKGNTLSVVAEPDQIVRHIPEVCNHCGINLSGIAPIFVGKRQAIDIPPVQPVYTQHETYQKQCSCGHMCTGSFPDHIKAPIQYGSSVANLVAYLSVRHYIPFKRGAEIFKDLFNIPLSEGTIANLLDDVAGKLQPSYSQIRNNIEKASSVGGDESGSIFDGSKGWFWIWQNRHNTFIAAAKSRGEKERKAIFPNGFPNAILNSDAYAVHLSTQCKAHQLCLAHLMRELNYFIELYPFNPWPQALKALFKKAIALEINMTQQQYAHCPERDKIEAVFNDLLKIPPASGGKLLAFFKRMVKNRDALFTFLHYPEATPDNNGSERGIRNVKVKQKVSGQFKSIDTAQNFAIIRSVIDTWIKRAFDILASFEILPNLAPE
jgi:transposase